jgi:hypothetical protein
MRRWFLSYTSQDFALTQALKAALKRKDPDADIFFAPESMRAGGFWKKQLAEEIEGSTAFILLVGEKGLGDWQVMEYYEALDRRAKEQDYPIILLLSAKRPAPGLPFARQLHWVLTEDPGSEATIGKLLDAASGPAQRPSELWRFTRPYRGLEAMTEANSDYFFGRGRETVDVINALASERGKLPILLGNSGVGKSSLAQAGVLAALLRQGWPEQAKDAGPWPITFDRSRHWCFLTLRPGTEPVRALAEPFIRAWQFDATDPRREERLNEWTDRLRASTASLRGLLDATQDRLHELGQVSSPSFFLYVDQGEGLYVRSEKQQRRRFSEIIADGLADPRLRTLMSLRADFFGDLQQDTALFAVHRQINVPPLRETELHEVVSTPAKLLSARFQTDTLAADIARRTAEESTEDAGALPLLSYLLDDMWTEMVQRGDGVLQSPTQAIDLGGVLVARANKFLAEHPDAEDSVRRILTLKLATVRQDSEPTRRRALRSEFSEDEWKLVSELADHPNRLVVTATAESSETYAEVAHEAIFRRWDKLRGWINAEREFLAWKTGLSDERRRWVDAPEESKKDALLMGLALVQAQDWLRRRGADLAAHDREFIELSSKAEAERRDASQRAEILRAKAEQELARQEAEQRLKNIMLLIASTAAVVLFVLAGVAVYQSRIAEEARSRAEERRSAALVIQSRYLADLSQKALQVGNPPSAILLALEALPDQPAKPDRPLVPDAERVLRLALSAPLALREFRSGTRANHAISPDGRILATISDDNVVRLWDTSSQELVRSIAHADGVTSIAFDSDGTRLVTASYDRTIRIWDVLTGRQVTVLNENDTDVVTALSFSPDGTRLLTASQDRTARLWDLQSEKVVGALTGHTDAVTSVAFSPDGRQILTSSADRTVRLWDAESTDQIRSLVGHEATVSSAIFSPDGSRIVSGSVDNTARVWNAQTGQQILLLAGHSSAILSVSINSGADRILTASRDQTARSWDTSTGNMIAILGSPGGTVFSASFSRDAKFVYTSHEDGVTRIWAAPQDLPKFGSVQAAVDYAKTIVSRCLSRRERERAFIDPEPRDWCIEMEKPPYQTQEWKDWLKSRSQNQNPPLPNS